MARRIARYKSGKYTVERPLHLGAALVGRLDDLAEPLSAYGLPLGEAFQMRDDILGTFGDPALTGKPVGEDLREGKPTPLLAIATARAGPAGLALLDRVGCPDLGDDEIAAIQAAARRDRRPGGDRAARRRDGRRGRRRPRPGRAQPPRPGPRCQSWPPSSPTATARAHRRSARPSGRMSGAPPGGRTACRCALLPAAGPLVADELGAAAAGGTRRSPAAAFAVERARSGSWPGS